MSKLTIIRGLPGSGKSTYAKSLGVLHLEADMFAVRNGEYCFNRSEQGNNHDMCKQLATKALQHGCDVVVSNTFTQRWEMQPYLDAALDCRVDVEVIRCVGTWKSVHDVPDAVIIKMGDWFEDYNGEIIHESKLTDLHKGAKLVATRILASQPKPESEGSMSNKIPCLSCGGEIRGYKNAMCEDCERDYTSTEIGLMDQLTELRSQLREMEQIENDKFVSLEYHNETEILYSRAASEVVRLRTENARLKKEADALLGDMLEIYAHLGAALSQSIPSDDQIIMGHIRDSKSIADRKRGE